MPGLRPAGSTGIAVARHGYGRPTRSIPMIEAGHPIPDAAGLKPPNARSRSPRARARTIWCWCCCRAARRRTGSRRSRAVARREAGGDAGAAALRRQHRRDQHGAQASLAHQGRAARARARSRRASSTLAISDVPGDDPAVIGSGPTVPDPTTLADARAIVARYRARSARSGDARARPIRATKRPKPGDPAFAATEFKLIARPADAFRAARGAVRGGRLRVRHARRPDRGRGARGRGRRTPGWRAHCRRQGRRAVILSGGELTVTIRGQGRGGPNQEYALALAIALDGAPGIAALAGDTDGTDGGGGLAPTTRPAPRSTRPRSPGPAGAASIRPIFSPTTIPPAFSAVSATWSRRVRPAPT